MVFFILYAEPLTIYAPSFYFGVFNAKPTAVKMFWRADGFEGFCEVVRICVSHRRLSPVSVLMLLCYVFLSEQN